MQGDGEAFGPWLKRRRKGLDLTQGQLAAAVGVQTVTIRHTEAGRSRPSRQLADSFATYFEIVPGDRAAFVAAARGGAQPLDTSAIPAPIPGRDLPLPPTPLLGREREIEDIRGLVLGRDARLLTLVGPPGVGKTSLAVEAATGLAESFPDGAHLAPLAPLADAALAPAAILEALGPPWTGEERCLATLLRVLRPKAALLLLDNCEHLDVAPLASELLAACPRLRILATSRGALRARGERVHEVPPLALPPLEPPPTPEDLLRYPSAALFVERAGAASRSFVLTPEDAVAVAEICAALDGLPLAIELVAARSALLPVGALLERLDSRLGLLTGGARDLPARQRTLRAALDWSHDLLGEGERALFAALGVFAGGASLGAIEVVCGPTAPVDPLDALSAIVGEGLLRRADGPGGEPRLAMLHTIREYAREKLDEGGGADELRERHAEYYLALAERAAPELRGPRQGEWLDRLDREGANVWAALGWAAEAGRWELGLRLASALVRYWGLRGSLRDGRRWLEAALSSDVYAPEQVRAGALLALGEVCTDLDEYAEADGRLREGLALYRGLGDGRGTGRCLAHLGLVAVRRGEYGEAERLCAEALALQEGAGDAAGAALSLNILANAALHAGRRGRAEELLGEVLALRRRMGDAAGEAGALNNLGVLLLWRGEHDRARALHEDALGERRALGDRRGVAESLNNLGEALEYGGDAQRARLAFGECLALRRELGAAEGIAGALVDVGWTLLLDGERGEAGDHLREALTLLRGLRAEQGVDDLWSGEVVAGCLEGLGAVACGEGRTARGVRLFAAAEAMRGTVGPPRSPTRRDHLRRAIAGAVSALGGGFGSAWGEGREMAADRAAEYALEPGGATDDSRADPWIAPEDSSQWEIH